MKRLLLTSPVGELPGRRLGSANTSSRPANLRSAWPITGCHQFVENWTEQIVRYWTCGSPEQPHLHLYARSRQRRQPPAGRPFVQDVTHTPEHPDGKTVPHAPDVLLSKICSLDSDISTMTNVSGDKYEYSRGPRNSGPPE